MILGVLANARELDKLLDTSCCKDSFVPNAGKLEEARTLKGPSREDHLLSGVDNGSIGQSHSSGVVAVMVLL